MVGWIWHKQQPNTPIQVDIYDGSKKLGTVTADQPRADLVRAGKGNGKHGYIYALPATVKDGKTHTIRGTIENTLILSNGQIGYGKTLNCTQ